MNTGTILQNGAVFRLGRTVKNSTQRLHFAQASHCTLMITVTIEIIHTTRGKKVKDINERHAWLLLNFTVDIKNE